MQEQRFITVSDVSELNITVDCSAHASVILFSFQSESNYGTYQNNSLESFAEVLLRTEKLTETKSEGKNLLPTTEGMDICVFTPVFSIETLGEAIVRFKSGEEYVILYSYFGKQS